MSKEGIPTIIGLLVFAALLVGMGITFSNTLSLVFASIAVLLGLFAVYFFRDPQRTPPEGDTLIVSPADGKVIAIESAKEDEYLEARVTKVAIFLSLFDVHVNYVPFSGTVDFIRYKRGKNLRANVPEASERNASILTGLLTEHGKMAFKQSTGMVARRLVTYLRLGDRVSTGQKFGIIKFGSRMEVYLPPNAQVNVNIGDRVRAGESVIAHIHEVE